MSNKTEYRKAKFSDLVDIKTLILFGSIMIFAIVQPLLSPSDEFNSDTVTLDAIPAWSGEPYVELNDNIPVFGEVDPDLGAYEAYSDLDELGRCTQAIACVSTMLMPDEERGNISEVKPTGWQRVEYDFIDGGLLYNRCHLIAHQLTGENANEKNLITGTRYMNEEGMNPFEIMVGDYVRETGNRVLYRVTPIFEGDDLIARGVQMEAWSIEDNGEGICFNIFCYNVQPGIEIDYATGDNAVMETACDHEAQDYVLNTNTLKYHLTTCEGVSDISEENTATFTGCYETLDARGYLPCGTCRPNE